jgi:hypothetical protein
MTTLSDTYREQIRILVDAVEEPTVEDIVLGAATRSRSRARPRLVAAVGAVVVVIALAVAVVMSSDDSAGPTRVDPAVSTTMPVSCIVVTEDTPGCDMAPSDAGAFLGFEARVPDGVPTGWVVERQKLQLYRHPESDGIGGFSSDMDPVAIYNQVWTPPGVDINRAGTCPTLLQVRQRPAWPGEGTPVGEPAVNLGAGRTIYGIVADPATCAGATTLHTTIHWVSDGIVFTVNADNVGRDHVLEVVESLFRS